MAGAVRARREWSLGRGILKAIPQTGIVGVGGLMRRADSGRASNRRFARVGAGALLAAVFLLISGGLSPTFASHQGTGTPGLTPLALPGVSASSNPSARAPGDTLVSTPMERRVTRIGQSDDFGLSWTPDSTALVIGRGGLSLLRQRIDRTLGHLIFNAAGTTDDAAGMPSVSPDGARVLFTHPIFSQFSSDIRIYALASQEVQLVPMPAGLRSPVDASWSPDGTRIVFSADDSNPPGNQRNVYVADADGSNVQRVTNFNAAAIGGQVMVRTPKWSPDGTKIVYDRGGIDVSTSGLHQVEVINVDGTGRNVVATDASDASWSPDGTKLAYSKKGARYQLVISNLTGDVSQTLTSAYDDVYPAWSPDGRYLAFSRNGGVWIRSLGPALPALSDVPVGVSINAGAPYTNSRAVNLRVVAPENASTVTVANDGGFGGARTFAVTDLEQNVPWMLSAPVAPLLPTVVYAHFTYGGPNYSDDIVLDTTAPAIQSVTATPVVLPTALKSGVGTSIKVRASDNRSGVRLTQVSRSRSALGAITRASTPSVLVPWTNTTSWVRVRDGAGNWSSWQAATRLPTRPSPVVAPRVTYPASGVVRVDWAPPVSSGYPIRLTYRVRVSAKNSAVYGPETMLTLNRHIFRVQPGGVYRVEIVAVNGSGGSAPVTVTTRPRP